jgi:hypothetical protein
MAVYPMKKEAEYPLALKEFAKEVGAPKVLVCDGSKAQNQRSVKVFCTQIGTTLKTLEAETQFANRSEMAIGYLKEPHVRIFASLDPRLCYGTTA